MIVVRLGPSWQDGDLDAFYLRIIYPQELIESFGRILELAHSSGNSWEAFHCPVLGETFPPHRVSPDLRATAGMMSWVLEY